MQEVFKERDMRALDITPHDAHQRPPCAGSITADALAIDANGCRRCRSNFTAPNRLLRGKIFM